MFIILIIEVPRAKALSLCHVIRFVRARRAHVVAVGEIFLGKCASIVCTHGHGVCVAPIAAEKGAFHVAHASQASQPVENARKAVQEVAQGNIDGYNRINGVDAVINKFIPGTYENVSWVVKKLRESDIGMVPTRIIEIGTVAKHYDLYKIFRAVFGLPLKQIIFFLEDKKKIICFICLFQNYRAWFLSEK